MGKALNRIMRPLFNVPGEGSFAFLMGIISGYPTGAKIVSNLKEKIICNTEECERLIAFTNNSGPLFIVGTVGSSLLSNSKIGFLLLFTHILACITVGFLFRFWKYKKAPPYRSSEDTSEAPRNCECRQFRRSTGNKHQKFYKYNCYDRWICSPILCYKLNARQYTLF